MELMERICDMLTVEEIMSVCQLDKWELVSEILADDVIRFSEEFSEAMDAVAMERE
jgi:hypothetical protein